MLPISVALNVLLLAAVVVLVLMRDRTIRPELPAAGSSWMHQPAQRFFAQMPGGKGGVVLLGDSLVAEGPWGELLGGPLNRGVKGDTVAGVRRRLGEVLARRPARLFLMIGINDVLNGGSAADVAAGVDAIAADVRSECPDTRLVVFSLLPVGQGDGATALNGTIREANRLLTDVAARRGAKFVDLHPLFAGPGGLLRADLTHDGLHLTPAGYLIWRDAVAREMQ